jgi:hypothetical protein
VVGVSAAKAHRVTRVARAVGQWAGAVRIVRSWVRGRPDLRLSPITGAGLDPSGTPAGIPSNGSDGEGCWGKETAGANTVGGVDVGRVVAVPVGGAAVVRFVEPGAAAQQLGNPPSITQRTSAWAGWNEMSNHSMRLRRQPQKLTASSQGQTKQP